MIQEPTSIQLLDAAVEQERETLGQPEPAVALASLLARWLLVRSRATHIDVVGLFARAHAYVAKSDAVGSRNHSDDSAEVRPR
jgi:hypothetical protein